MASAKARAGITLGGILGEGAEDDGLERDGDAPVAAERARRGRRLGDVGGHGGDRASPFERRLAHGHLEEHHPGGVEIAAGVGLVAAGLLGSHVLGRAEDHPLLGEAGQLLVAVDEAGEAEVDDLDADLGGRLGRRRRAGRGGEQARVRARRRGRAAHLGDEHVGRLRSR